MKKLLLFLLVASAAGTGTSQPTADERPAGWPQFRGNPRMTGVAASTPPDSLNLLWTYEAGDSIDSSAAIVDGVVYVGVGNGDLLAVDLASGRCGGDTQREASSENPRPPWAPGPFTSAIWMARSMR